MDSDNHRHIHTKVSLLKGITQKIIFSHKDYILERVNLTKALKLLINNGNYNQCLTIEAEARNTHAILNQIIVGIVLIVDVKIKAKLDARANIYNHQNCTPNNRPGNMMAILVMKAQASTMFVLVQ
jgi:hypothetical protein